MKPLWLTWAQRIQAIAQAGLEYSPDRFDRERFAELRELSVEIVALHTEAGADHIAGLFANESGYQTPKVDIRAVVHQDGRILLVREMDDGRWALPGGWAEINLSVKENAEKEVLEESGVTATARRIVAILDRNRYTDDVYPYSVYKIFVECVPHGGAFEPNIETSDARFFAAEELPPLSELRNTARQIQMCFDFIEGSLGEVVFD